MAASNTLEVEEQHAASVAEATPWHAPWHTSWGTSNTARGGASAVAPSAVAREYADDSALFSSVPGTYAG